jgi:hypothetical protein
MLCGVVLTSLEIADSSEIVELNAAMNHEHREVRHLFSSTLLVIVVVWCGVV